MRQTWPRNARVCNALSLPYLILYSHLDPICQLCFKDLSKAEWANPNPVKDFFCQVGKSAISHRENWHWLCLSEYTILVPRMWKVVLSPLQSISSSGAACNLRPHFCPREGPEWPPSCLGQWGPGTPGRCWPRIQAHPALDHWLRLRHLCLGPWPWPFQLSPHVCSSLPCIWDAGPLPKATISCDGPSAGSSDWH